MTSTLERNAVERLVREAITRKLHPGYAPTPTFSRKGEGNTEASNGKGGGPRIVVNISARHCHVTQDDLERLFGKGHRLRVHKELYQDGFFAAEEAVTLIGPRQRII